MGFSYTFSDNFHVKTNSKNYRVVSFSATVIYTQRKKLSTPDILKHNKLH